MGCPQEQTNQHGDAQHDGHENQYAAFEEID